MSLLPPVPVCNRLIENASAPVPVEFRSAEIAGAVRIMGSALAGAAALIARVERVFVSFQKWVGHLLHALKSTAWSNQRAGSVSEEIGFFIQGGSRV